VAISAILRKKEKPIFMSMLHPGINCYCHFCGSPLRFQIARAGETVNCFNCCMETVLFIPGLQAPYSVEECVVEARDIRWAENRFGVRHVQGCLENKSGRHLSWLRIEFILFGKQGCPIGSTSDCLIGVPPAKVWKFQAPVCQTEALQASGPLLACEYGRLCPPEKTAIAKDRPMSATPQASTGIRGV